MTTCEIIPRPRPVSTLNRKVYLGLYDNRTWPEPDSRDEQRVRDFMVQKYENKRFFVAPTEAMREEARRMNDAALSKQPQTKPLRALLGENATRLVVGNSQTSPASQNNTQQAATATSSMAAPPKSTLPPPVTAQAQTQQPTKPSAGGFDLLGDLGSDPFASSTPATASASTGGFADFSNFGSAPSQPSAPPAQTTAPPAFPPMSGAPLQPFNSGGGGGLQPQPLGATPVGSTPAPTSTPSQSTAANFSAISDKYAALADLDSTFNTVSTQSSNTVNWGGSDITPTGGVNWGGLDSQAGSGGGSVNWGGPSSTTTGSGDGGSFGWGGQSGGGSGGLSWNSSGSSSGVGGSTPVGGSAFGGATSTAANPFGGSSAPPMSVGGGAMSGQANPFGASTQPAGFGQAPASSAGGFGFQQFPVQNGGFGMNTTAGGFAPFGGPPPSTAPPSYGAAQQQGFQAQPGMAPQGFSMGQPAQPGGFQQQPAMGAGWGQMGGTQTANPFMSTANQQQMAPRGKSTNPFL